MSSLISDFRAQFDFDVFHFRNLKLDVGDRVGFVALDTWQLPKPSSLRVCDCICDFRKPSFLTGSSI